MPIVLLLLLAASRLRHQIHLLVPRVPVFHPSLTIRTVSTPSPTALSVIGMIKTVIIPDVFGRRALGRINGLVTGLGVAASGLGPLVFGSCEQLTGSYTYAMVLLLGWLLVGMALLETTGVPVPPRRRVPNLLPMSLATR